MVDSLFVAALCFGFFLGVLLAPGIRRYGGAVWRLGRRVFETLTDTRHGMTQLDPGRKGYGRKGQVRW